MVAKRKTKIRGSQDRPRLAVYRSARHIYAQIIDDGAGQTLAAASSLDGHESAAKTKGKNGLAEWVGKAVAEKAKSKGIQKVVFDRKTYRYHGRVKALADAARQGGLQF